MSLIGLVVSLSLITISPAWATTVLEHSFSSLVHEADTIAYGTVTEIAAEWDAQRNAPFTLIRLTDLTVLKGDPTQTELTLEFFGGPTPDGTHIQIAGMPPFTVGDRAVVFVVGNGTVMTPLVGLWQGAYRVVFDPAQEADVMATYDGQPLTALPTPRTPGGMLHYDQGQALTDATEPALLFETFLRAIEDEVSHAQ